MKKNRKGVLLNGAAFFFPPTLFIAEECGGECGAFSAWARRAWGHVSFGLGRVSLPTCPLGAWRAGLHLGSLHPNWRTGLHSLSSSGLEGYLARVARIKVCFWASWLPLVVFWFLPGFRPLPGLEMVEARSCSGPLELRSLRSIGLGRMRDYLSGSRTDRSVMVGPRYDSMESLLPCVLGICPRLTDRVPL